MTDTKAPLKYEKPELNYKVKFEATAEAKLWVVRERGHAIAEFKPSQEEQARRLCASLLAREAI